MTAAVLDVRHAAAALGGVVVGRASVAVPGPGHSPADRSLSVRFDPNAPDGFRVFSFADDDWRVCRDHVKALLGITSPKYESRIRSMVRQPRELPTDVAERTRRALEIWRGATDPRGTTVELYLRSRGLDLPDDAAGEAIRFHRSCPWKGAPVPAMVCLVRDVVTNAERAIHRTALTADGRKRDDLGSKGRMSLGPTRGGAIKLTPDESVTTCLGVGEGVESVLSLRHAPEFGGSPVWSLIAEGGVSTLPVLPGIECLWVAVDHDPAGLTAAQTVANRWRRAGNEVFLIKSVRPKEDLNDLVEVPNA
jgi:putative DNA primase/helicase